MKRKVIILLPRGSSDLLISAYYFYKIIIFTFFLTFFCDSGIAQWKKLHDFGDEINTIYFKEFSSTPQDGFVSVFHNNSKRSDKIWRTMDGGYTWQQISYPSDNLGNYQYPNSFTFKNSFEGWWSGFQEQTLYMTLDGGNTWTSKYLSPLSIQSLFYANYTDRLLFAGTPNFFSPDGGITFTNYPIGLKSQGNGVAFTDSIHGIMSPLAGPIIYTSDGGISWNNTNQYGERYQPIGIRGTLTFYALQEGIVYPAGSIVRSDDGGVTWRTVYEYHYTGSNGVSGTLQYNSKGIFFQTAQDNSEGIMMSEDSAQTFFTICGPTNDNDTRFYVRDSFIYAGDKQGGLWLNTTGIGSNPTPQLSTSQYLFLQTSGCNTKDSIITITFFDSCNKIQAKLVNASISGTNNFSLLAPFNSPRTIHPNDSIIVHYDPSALLSDSASLHLRFHLGWKDFDTTIQLIGSAQFNILPHISSTNIHFSNNCNFPDSLITFSFFDSCSNSQAELVSASLQGSNNFSFSSPSAIPRTIHRDDSLLISYNPNSPVADTASLHLKFHLGWKDFDTTIMLTGAGRIPKEKVQFTPSLSANAVSAGSTVDILIKPNKNISGKALQSISFDLNYNSDLLDGGKIFSTGIPGATITVGPEKSPSPSIPLLRAREVVVTGSDLSLDPNIAIADLKFMAMVTDTTSTPITISNLKLNGGDVDYQNCILSADTSATNFIEIYLCGDSTLSKYLRTGNILTITSIHPNPAQDEITVVLQSPLVHDATIEIFDELGTKMSSQIANTRENSFTLKTSGFPAGMYIVRVRTDMGTASQSFLKLQ